MFDFDRADADEFIDPEWSDDYGDNASRRALEDAANDEDRDFDAEWEDDGQPSEYDEWQDVYGGDVEEYGTFGDYDDGGW